MTKEEKQFIDLIITSILKNYNEGKIDSVKEFFWSAGNRYELLCENIYTMTTLPGESRLFVSINGESFINNIPPGYSLPLFEVLTINEFSPKCSDIIMYVEVVLDHLQKQISSSQIELIG
ncbi:MAG: hypothetical protein IJZ42_13460 [Lachnospiraceae bacterium]|nr:hypothetical protein [Lachnospiraceae bacterium]